MRGPAATLLLKTELSEAVCTKFLEFGKPSSFKHADEIFTKCNFSQNIFHISFAIDYMKFFVWGWSLKKFMSHQTFFADCFVPNPKR